MTDDISKEVLVSIIIPTYKSSATLSRAIESCINQTYANLEIVVVDDNSPGSSHRRLTQKLMKSFRNEKRVIYVQHDKNRKGSAARNTGFKYANGDYITYLDDDDYYDPNKVIEQVAYLNKHHQYMAATCVTYKNGQIVNLQEKVDYTIDILTLNTTPNTNTIMISRVAYLKQGGWDESYSRHQDYEFLLRYFAQYKMGLAKKAVVHIKTDGFNNMPAAKQLESIKLKLLSDFKYIIDDGLRDNKLRKKTYAAQYAELFCAYVSEYDLANSLRILRVGYSEAGIRYASDILSYGFRYIQRRLFV